MSRLTNIIANHLQAFYERNRVPETWGSPELSRPFFDILRQDGFIAATRFLFARLREVGRPDWSPFRKFLALVAGILIVAAINKFFHILTKERRPEVRAAGKRKFSIHAPKTAILLYAIGAALLVAENGEEVQVPERSDNPDDPGYWGPSSIFKDSAGNVDYQPFTRHGQPDGRGESTRKSDYDDFDGDQFDDNYNG